MIHPTVANVIRHAEAGFPLMSVPLIGTEQERFASDLADAIRDKDDCSLQPLWFDISTWPQVIDMLTGTAINTVAQSTGEDESPFDNEYDDNAVTNAIRWLTANARAANEETNRHYMLIMSNVSRFFAVDGMNEHTNILCQTLRKAVMPLKEIGFSILFVGNATPHNPVIERLITELDSALPTIEDHARLCNDLRDGRSEVEKKQGMPPLLRPLTEEEALTVGRAASGLTYFEAENVFALLIAELLEHDGHDGMFDLIEIIKKKKEIIEAIPGVELFLPRDNDQLENLIGLTHAMEVIKAALTTKPKHPKARAKGFILNGVVGTGKSDLCRKLSNMTGSTVMRWNPKNSQGGFVGQTEKNVQAFFKIVDAIGHVLVIVDEADSAFSGGGTGKTDGGVQKGIIGATQTFMQENDTTTFFFTTNDLSLIPGPMKRSGRIDEIFWFGFPSREEIVRMFSEVWCPYYNYELVKGELDKMNLDNWVGADVEAAVRKAVGRGKRLSEISIAPSYIFMGEEISRWKEAAHGNICASTGQVMLWDGKDLKPAGDPGKVTITSVKRHIKKPNGKGQKKGETTEFGNN